MHVSGSGLYVSFKSGRHPPINNRKSLWTQRSLPWGGGRQGGGGRYREKGREGGIDRETEATRLAGSQAGRQAGREKKTKTDRQIHRQTDR